MKNRMLYIINMKRKSILIIYAVLLLTIMTGCVHEESAGEPDESVASVLPDTLSHDRIQEEFTNEQIQAAIAGNWRSQRHDGYTANDMIISLFADGTWEWSGPLAADHVDGGRYFITRAEDDIYHISLIIEHSTSEYTQQIDHIMEEILQYDLQNDRLSQQDPSTEIPGVMISVQYIRVPHAVRDAAPTWNEDGLTSAGADTADGFEYCFDALGFAFTLPHSWDGYYELRGNDDGNIDLYFDSMGVFALLFMISPYDIYDSHVLETDEFEITRTFDAGNVKYMMYHRPWVRTLLLETEDFSSFEQDMTDEMNLQIKNTLSRMFHESDTIIADSIRILP